MSIVTCIRCNGPTRVFYQRLRDEGKPTKVAMVASMRRLLTVPNAMIRARTPWQSRPTGPRHATGLPRGPTISSHWKLFHVQMGSAQQALRIKKEGHPPCPPIRRAPASIRPPGYASSEPIQATHLSSESSGTRTCRRFRP